MGRHRRDVSFEALALDRVIASDPMRVGMLLDGACTDVATRALEALPALCFSLQTHCIAAFRTLWKGANIGKIVLQVGPCEESPTHISLIWRVKHALTVSLASGSGICSKIQNAATLAPASSADARLAG